MNQELQTDDGRAHRVRVIAAGCMALAFAVVIASAWIRLRRAGMGCVPWPECLPTDPAGLGVGAAPLARLAHRIAASLLLVGALAMALHAATARVPPALRARAFGLAGLTLGLAALGALAGPSSHVAVALANLLGGYAVLAVAGSLATAPGTAAPAWLGIMVVIQVVLGAATSLGHEAARGRITAPWMAHAILALALLCTLGLAARAGRASTRGARPHFATGTLAVIVVLQGATGLLTMRTGALAAAWAHALGAAAMVAALSFGVRPAGSEAQEPSGAGLSGQDGPAS